MGAPGCAVFHNTARLSTPSAMLHHAIASHRAEMRALRDNGVYGSSMAPYLDELRRVYDATEARKAEAEEAPAEFSESDESDEESDDDASDDSDDESKEDSGSESDTGEDQLVEVAEETRGGTTEGGDGFEDARVATGSERRGKHPARLLLRGAIARALLVRLLLAVLALLLAATTALLLRLLLALLLRAAIAENAAVREKAALESARSQAEQAAREAECAQRDKEGAPLSREASCCLIRMHVHRAA